jgi:hypothetical protein
LAPDPGLEIEGHNGLDRVGGTVNWPSFDMGRSGHVTLVDRL